MAKPAPNDAVREHLSAIRQYLESKHPALHGSALREEMISILCAYQIDEDMLWTALWLGDETVFDAMINAHGSKVFELDDGFGGRKFWENIQNIPSESGLRARAVEAFGKAHPLKEQPPGYQVFHDMSRAFWTDDPDIVDTVIQRYGHPTNILEQLVDADWFFALTKRTAKQKMGILQQLHQQGVDLTNLMHPKACLILACLGVPFGAAYQHGTGDLALFAKAFKSNHQRLRMSPFLPNPEEIFATPDQRMPAEIARILEHIADPQCVE